MRKTRLTSKGRITLPKSVREAHRWNVGTEFIVEETPLGVVLRPTVRRNKDLDEVFGCLRYKGKRKTIAEISRVR